MATPNGVKTWAVRVSAGLAVIALAALAKVAWGHEGRITRVEVHIPYIKEKVDEIQTEQRVWFDKIERKLEGN